MNEPLYSVGTWDSEAQGFTPQEQFTRCLNVPLWSVRRILRDLRRMGYGAYRFRCSNGQYESDPMIMVERTDGMTETEILEMWTR